VKRIDSGSWQEQEAVAGDSKSNSNRKEGEKSQEKTVDRGLIYSNPNFQIHTHTRFIFGLPSSVFKA
jgi:hypothetical protein